MNDTKRRTAMHDKCRSPPIEFSVRTAFNVCRFVVAGGVQGQHEPRDSSEDLPDSSSLYLTRTLADPCHYTCALTQRPL